MIITVITYLISVERILIFLVLIGITVGPPKPEANETSDQSLKLGDTKKHKGHNMWCPAAVTSELMHRYQCWEKNHMTSTDTD